MADLVNPPGTKPSVLDPFMGSVSTALPVVRRGGTFTGIELTVWRATLGLNSKAGMGN